MHIKSEKVRNLTEIPQSIRIRHTKNGHRSARFHTPFALFPSAIRSIRFIRWRNKFIRWEKSLLPWERIFRLFRAFRTQLFLLLYLTTTAAIIVSSRTSMHPMASMSPFLTASGSNTITISCSPSGNRAARSM